MFDIIFYGYGKDGTTKPFIYFEHLKSNEDNSRVVNQQMHQHAGKILKDDPDVESIRIDFIHLDKGGKLNGYTHWIIPSFIKHILSKAEGIEIQLDFQADNSTVFGTLVKVDDRSFTLRHQYDEHFLEETYDFSEVLNHFWEEDELLVQMVSESHYLNFNKGK